MTRTPATRRAIRVLRGLVPFGVSAALLVYLFRRIDAGEALARTTPDVLLRFLAPVVFWNFVTLAIEARCLHRVAAAHDRSLPLVVAARIKAACYLLSIVYYPLGSAGLSVLLGRRARVPLAEAIGMVFLITLFDLGSVTSLAAIGATFLRADALGVRIGLLVALVAAIIAGFAFLKAPFPLGPLEALRRLPILRAPRQAGPLLLLELGVLRALFVGTYVALTHALLGAYGLEVEPTRLALNVAIMLAVSALPIAAGGLGTGQLVFVALFAGVAPD
ncbi:MAG TPA: lysylphosphatidylglycerol synthase domain-containing protein, partial [Myxococcota bacterium]|nr:lysylphosphatidylglycerol synthase domain-containing protein [Myxococcota bacterium]